MEDVTWSAKIINPLMIRKNDLEQLLMQANRMIYEVDGLLRSPTNDTEDLVNAQNHLKHQVEKIKKLYKVVPADFALSVEEFEPSKILDGFTRQ